MSDDHLIGSGLTQRQLSLATLWLKHGQRLRRLGYAFLLSLGVLFWGYTLWTVVDTYVISYPRESRIINHIAQLTLDPNTIQSSTPQPIQLSEVSTFATTGNRQDFLVELTNPNPQWWLAFTYHFESDADKTSTRSSYILPQTQRYLTELGVKNLGRSPQLIIDSINWHRVDPKNVEGDYPTFLAKHNQLQINDVKYQNDLTIGNQTVGRTTLTLVNPSGYGFWGVDLTAVLTRGGNPIAVSTVTEREIKPGEIRPITIDWFENLPGISKTDIQLNVNILDPKVYLPTTQFSGKQD